MNYTFTFTEAEANTILQALASKPYIEVANLISNFQRQAHTQSLPKQTDVIKEEAPQG